MIWSSWIGSPEDKEREKTLMANVFPQQFGPYTLHQLVGRGGMAEIYRATMPGIGSFEKVLAIKKILPHLVENEEYITMLTDEARLVVGLNHANIAQVYDLGRIDDSYYIAMEYIHGVDIATIIKDAQKKNRPIPYEHIAYMMSGLCMGLHVAHHATGKDGQPLNIIHRDISPHNVLISFAGDVKVIDFGVAKASSKEGQTQVGVIKGKLLYMAPEQAMAKDIDGRADLFAAGLVMYKMLTWELPFQGENEFQIYNNILTKEIVPPKVLNPGIPEELNQICMTLLQRDVDRRYQDGYAAKRELERALHHIAPGYTPSRLSRFIEDNFLEMVQERLRRQNTPAAQQAAARANSRIKEPVRTGAAPQSPQGAMGQGGMQQGHQPTPTTRPAPPMPSNTSGQRSAVNFGPTPVPSDPSPMTPNGFQPPGHQTPAPGFNPAAMQGAMRTQNANNLATGSFPSPEMSGILPTPRQEEKKKVPAILIAVILLGLLFLGMGIYVVVSSDAATAPEEPSTITPPENREPPEAQQVVPEEKEDEPAKDEVVPEPEVEPMTFVLTTEPEGAVIFRNGMRQGLAPLNLEVSETDIPVTLKATLEGYEPQEIKLTGESERELLITLVKSEEDEAPKAEDKPKDTKKVSPRTSTTKSTTKSTTQKPESEDKGTAEPVIKGRDSAKDAIDLFGGSKPKKTTESKKKKNTTGKDSTTSSKPKDDGSKKLDAVLDDW